MRALDPVNVLARGWTITRHADGRIVRSPDELDVDDVLVTQFAAGTSGPAASSTTARTTNDDRWTADPRTPSGYAQALDELDGILRELEGSDVDVDRLADRVAGPPS